CYWRWPPAGQVSRLLSRVRRGGGGGAGLPSRAGRRGGGGGRGPPPPAPGGRGGGGRGGGRGPPPRPRGGLPRRGRARGRPPRGTDDLDYWTLRAAHSVLDVPCAGGTRAVGRLGVVAGRSAAHLVPEAATIETVLVYRNAQAAVATMAEVRRMPTECANPGGNVTPYVYTVRPLT